jgi:hypothetical protein
MNLVKYDQNNSQRVRSGKACVNFSRKGASNISKKAQEMMGLKEGDSVAIYQDNDNPADWYMAKDKDGFQCRRNTAGLMFNSAMIANSILDCFSYEGKSFSFLIGSEPLMQGKQELWPIITASIQS